ncbi:MAG: NADH-quinone oxidoreductase subunit M, partial [Nitrospiraceae bacterium]
MSDSPILSLVVFLPLAGAVGLFFVKESLVRWTALVVALADLGLSLPLWVLFDPSTPRMQFTERVSWIASP